MCFFALTDALLVSASEPLLVQPLAWWPTHFCVCRGSIPRGGTGGTFAAAARPVNATTAVLALGLAAAARPECRCCFRRRPSPPPSPSPFGPDAAIALAATWPLPPPQPSPLPPPPSSPLPHPSSLPRYHQRRRCRPFAASAVGPSLLPQLLPTRLARLCRRCRCWDRPRCRCCRRCVSRRWRRGHRRLLHSPCRPRSGLSLPSRPTCSPYRTCVASTPPVFFNTTIRVVLLSMLIHDP